MTHSDVLPAHDVFPMPRPRAAARRREQRRHAFGRRGLVFTIALSSLSTVTGLGLAQAYFRVTSTTEARAQVHVETTGPLELAIQGGVADLAPGGPIQLITVQLDNRGIQPYRLTELTPSFTNLPAGCPASAFSVHPPATWPTLAVQAHAALQVGISLRADVPTACQGAEARISLRAVGVTS